jgi:hypothetical protein
MVSRIEGFSTKPVDKFVEQLGRNAWKRRPCSLSIKLARKFAELLRHKNQ